MTDEKREAYLALLTEQLEKRRSESRKLLIGAVLAALAAILALVSGYLQLEQARRAQEAEADALRVELIRLQHQKNELASEVSQLDAQARSLRESFEYLRLGLEAFHSKNFQGAVFFYRKAIAATPDDAVLHGVLGYALFKRKEYAQAIIELKLSKQIDDKYPWARYNLALALWAAGEKDAALQEIRELVALDPSFVRVIRQDGQFREFATSEKFRAMVGINN